MVAAGRIATLLNFWSEAEEIRQRLLITKAGLEIRIPQKIQVDDVLNLLQNDKKVKAGKVRFILPEAIGKVIISDRVSEAVIREAIALLK